MMWDVSTSWEHYHGQWDREGNWLPDPAGSDLNQYRLTGAFGYRLADNWQMAVALPYVINNNHYNGLDANSQGLGDSTLAVKYESFESPQCVYQVTSWVDLIPAIYWGLNLTLPTGLSPYDDIADNFEITGRGFYRLDGSLLLDKTIYPWSASLALNYGTHLQRPVNRDYGNYVDPYQKQLGDRSSYTLALGYVYTTDAISEVTTTLAYTDLQEAKAWESGGLDASTSFKKRSLALTVAWADITKSWVVKTTWSHTPSEDGWGESFAATDTLSVGVSHVYW